MALTDVPHVAHAHAWQTGACRIGRRTPFSLRGALHEAAWMSSWHDSHPRITMESVMPFMT